MADPDLLASLEPWLDKMVLEDEVLPETTQSIQPEQRASLNSLPDCAILTIGSYLIPLSNPLTAFVKASYQWTEDGATAMMYDSWQPWSHYLNNMPPSAQNLRKPATLRDNLTRQKPNVDLELRFHLAFAQLNGRIRGLMLKHIHDRRCIIFTGELSHSEALLYQPEHPKRYRRDLRRKHFRRRNTNAKKAAVSVQDYQLLQERLNPIHKQDFIFWDPILRYIDISKLPYLHFKFGYSKYEWYWKWVPRCMIAFCEQRMGEDKQLPKQLLLEFEDRPHGHKFRPNGKYDGKGYDLVLVNQEPGTQYADRQYKDYERTLRKMVYWLRVLGERVRISLPYWMEHHKYKNRIPRNFGEKAGNDVIFQPFATDRRYQIEWASNTSPSSTRTTSLGLRSQYPEGEFEFEYSSSSGEESPVNDEIELSSDSPSAEDYTDSDPDVMIYPSDESSGSGKAVDERPSSDEEGSDSGSDDEAAKLRNPFYIGPEIPSTPSNSDEETDEDDSESKDDSGDDSGDDSEDDADDEADDEDEEDPEDDAENEADDELEDEDDDDDEMQDKDDDEDNESLPGQDQDDPMDLDPAGQLEGAVTMP